MLLKEVRCDKGWQVNYIFGKTAWHLVETYETTTVPERTFTGTERHGARWNLLPVPYHYTYIYPEHQTISAKTFCGLRFGSSNLKGESRKRHSIKNQLVTTGRVLIDFIGFTDKRQEPMCANCDKESERREDLVASDPTICRPAIDYHAKPPLPHRGCLLR